MPSLSQLRRHCCTSRAADTSLPSYSTSSENLGRGDTNIEQIRHEKTVAILVAIVMAMVVSGCAQPGYALTKIGKRACSDPIHKFN